MLAKLLTTSIALFAVKAEQITLNMPLEELGLETITFDPGFNVDINFDVLKNAGAYGLISSLVYLMASQFLTLNQRMVII